MYLIIETYILYLRYNNKLIDLPALTANLFMKTQKISLASQKLKMYKPTIDHLILGSISFDYPLGEDSCDPSIIINYADGSRLYVGNPNSRFYDMFFYVVD